METSFSTSVEAVAAPESWWSEAWAVFTKDLRSELRTKAALGALLVFALTTIVLISFTIVTTGLGLDTKVVARPEEAIRLGKSIYESVKTEARCSLLSSLYWVILFFSAMAGIPRVFVKEEEMRTAGALRLAARPSAVFAGKLSFNILLMMLVAFLALGPFTLLMNPEVTNWPLFLGHALAGAAGMAAGASLLGAIVARAGSNGYLMVVLGFGPLLPILILAINGTTAALYGSGGNNLAGLVSYLVAVSILSGGLFEKVWAE
jgi:heme exporter protein B